jgi:hypothetical protein
MNPGTRTAAWYDVTADGNRFVLMRPDEKTGLTGFTHVNLTFNFFTEIQRALSPK